MEHSETVLAWSLGRRLHLVAPTGVFQPVDLAAIEKLIGPKAALRLTSGVEQAADEEADRRGA